MIIRHGEKGMMVGTSHFSFKRFVFSVGAATVIALSSLQPAKAGVVVLTAPPGSSTAVQTAVDGVNAACGVFFTTGLDGLCSDFAGWAKYTPQDYAQVAPAHQQALGETLRERESEMATKLIGAVGRTQFLRTAAREGRAPGFAFNGKRYAWKDLQVAAATDEANDWIAQNDDVGGLGGKLGAFLNLEYGKVKQDQTASEAGFDSDVVGALAGVDYRFSDQFTGGASFAFKNTQADFTSYASGSKFRANDYLAALYASYYPTNSLYFDFFGSYGIGKFKTKRFFFPFNQTAKGDTDGTQYGLSATAGYQLYSGALTYGPYVQGNWLRAKVDAYTETGSGLALAIEQQSLTSLTSVLGFRFDYAFSTSFGVIVPSLRAEWEHEYDNDSRVITAQFASDPGSFMNLPTSEPDRNYFNVGLGATMTLAGGMTTFVDYETMLGNQDLTVHKVTAGLRFEF